MNDTYIEVKLGVSSSQRKVTLTHGGNTFNASTSDCNFFNSPRNENSADDYWLIYKSTSAYGLTLSVGTGLTPGKGMLLLVCSQQAQIRSNVMLPRTSNLVLNNLHISAPSLLGGVRMPTNWFGGRGGDLVKD